MYVLDLDTVVDSIDNGDNGLDLFEADDGTVVGVGGSVPINEAEDAPTDTITTAVVKPITVVAAAPSKMSIARAIYAEEEAKIAAKHAAGDVSAKLVRKDVIARIMTEANASKACAGTYYQTISSGK